MAKKTIRLKAYSNNIIEKNANAAITPGMLIEEMSTGKVRAHAQEGQTALPMFAIEDALQGKTIDQAYAADAPLRCWIPYRGDEVYAILENGQDVAIGDFLESNGAGYLQPHAADSTIEYANSIVCQAIEAVDTSEGDSSGDSGALGFAKRIKVRII